MTLPFLQNLSRLAQMAGQAEYATDPDFLAVLNAIIDDAEQRAYRDLDLLMTRVTDGSAALTQSARAFTLPTTKGIFVVVEQVSLFYPAIGGVQQPPLLPVSKEALEQFWPSDLPPTTPSLPTLWSPIDQVSIMVGPPPDLAYPVVVFGTQRPLPLYTGATLNTQTNQFTITAGSPAADGTVLSNFFPDLFLAAQGVFLSAWQRNFGTEVNDPQMALSCEQHYQALLKSSVVEQQRARFAGPGWSARLPSPTATPPQT